MTDFSRQFKRATKTALCGVRDATTSAAILNTEDCNQVLLQAKSTNTDTILIGNSSGQFIELVPGASVTIIVKNESDIYQKSVSGTQKLNYFST